jgi:phenylacetate-CoA ligase
MRVFRRAAYLARMLRNESLAPATLLARQMRSLRALVGHAAARVPFYRELYAAHGIHAPSLQTLDDLGSLPIVDKNLLRAAGAGAQSLDASPSAVTITTSGSTAEPFVFQIDRDYDQWRKAQYLRPYLRSGQRLRDKVFRLSAQPTRRTPWYTRLGLMREWGFDCDSDSAEVAAHWRRLAPDVLQGYPSSLRLLAHHCLQRGEPLQPAPRLVFTDSELLLPDARDLIERAFGTPPIDIFGTFETDNIAFQCEAREGYHIAIDCVVLEIVRDGKPVPMGEEGEIVVTVLRNRRVPFIRYNLRDMGRLSSGRCACGSPFPLLGVIQGRANDLIVLADGSRRSPQKTLARIKRFADAIRAYQLWQTHIGRFELIIVPSDRFSDADRAEVLRALEAELGDARIELRLMDAIPADRSGKRRAFICKLAVN